MVSAWEINCWVELVTGSIMIGICFVILYHTLMGNNNKWLLLNVSLLLLSNIGLVGISFSYRKWLNQYTTFPPIVDASVVAMWATCTAV